MKVAIYWSLTRETRPKSPAFISLFWFGHEIKNDEMLKRATFEKRERNTKSWKMIVKDETKRSDALKKQFYDWSEKIVLDRTLKFSLDPVSHFPKPVLSHVPISGAFLKIIIHAALTEETRPVSIGYLQLEYGGRVFEDDEEFAPNFPDVFFSKESNWQLIVRDLRDHGPGKKPFPKRPTRTPPPIPYDSSESAGAATESEIASEEDYYDGSSCEIGDQIYIDGREDSEASGTRSPHAADDASFIIKKKIIPAHSSYTTDDESLMTDSDDYEDTSTAAEKDASSINEEKNWKDSLYPRYFDEKNGINPQPYNENPAQFARAPLDDGIPLNPDILNFAVGSPFERINIHVNLVNATSGEDKHATGIRDGNILSVCGDRKLHTKDRLTHFYDQVLDPTRNALVLRAGASLVTISDYPKTVQEPLFGYELNLKKIVKMWDELRILGLYNGSSDVRRYTEKYADKKVSTQENFEWEQVAKFGEDLHELLCEASRNDVDDLGFVKNDSDEVEQRDWSEFSAKKSTGEGQTSDESNLSDEIEASVVHNIRKEESRKKKTKFYSYTSDGRPDSLPQKVTIELLMRVFKLSAGILDRYKRALLRDTFKTMDETREMFTEHYSKSKRHYDLVRTYRDVTHRDPDLTSRGFIYYRSNMMKGVWAASYKTVNGRKDSADDFQRAVKHKFAHPNASKSGVGEHLCFGMEITVREREWSDFLAKKLDFGEISPISASDVSDDSDGKMEYSDMWEHDDNLDRDLFADEDSCSNFSTRTFRTRKKIAKTKIHKMDQTAPF